MLKPGEIIDDRYIVEVRLGQGGLAEVFRVRHRELNSVHALKLLVWRRQSLIERILLEGRIQAQIRHPNVVAVTDVIRHDGRCGLLMEYIDGLTLEDYLRQRGALPIDDALSLIAPVIAAITAAHDAGVLHRDLKPANVLLARMSGGLFPKVADFGIAKVVVEDMARNATVVGSLMGSPGYLAPEQVIDSGSVDQRTDIYALGVMLYEVLAGVRAFPEVIDAASAREGINITPPALATLRPDCPDYLCAAIEKAMAQDRDDRFPDCRSLARALFEAHPRLLSLVDRQQLSSKFSLDLLPAPPPATDPTLLPMTNSGLPASITAQPASPTTTETGLKALVIAPLVLAALLSAGVIGGGVVWYLNHQPVAVPAVVAVEPEVVLVPATPEPVEPPPVGAVVELEEPEVVEPEPEVVEPEVTTAPVITRPPPEVVEPEPEVVAPEPEPEEPEPEVVEPEPEEPEPEAVAVIEPEPEPEVLSIDLSGQWSGTADLRPLQLRITDNDGSVRAEFSFLIGNTQRTIVANGTFDSASGVFQATSSAEGLTFLGKLSGSTLSGTYRKGRKGKAFDWRASR
ncbi:MAG: serine/threonine protein kinase [Myxococcota bacterium]